MAFPHKRERVAEAIRAWIAEGKFKPGDRFPSDQELARRFRVTHVTVRAALKPLVEAGVLERRIGFGTIVRAPRAAGADSRLATAVGVAIPDNTHSFFPEILRAVEASLFPTGRPLLLGHTWEQPEREHALVRGWLAQGLTRLLVVPTGGDAALYRELAARGVRVVFVDRVPPSIDAPSVTGRDGDGARALTQLLVDLGHRIVVHLAGPRNASTAEVRRTAFEDVCRAAGVSAEIAPAGFFLEDGYRAMSERLARGKPPDAVLAANDPVAIGAMRALAERGLDVPSDVSVAGFGDTDLGRNAQLTSVRQFPERLGAEAVRLLLAPGDVSSHDSVLVDQEVVVRRSTAARTGRARRVI